MTDKEKLDAIRAEIHRLVDVRGYDKEMANDLFAFMDSLPNEPVSEDLESEIQHYNNSLNLDAEENYEWDDIASNVILAARHFAKWQKAKDESTTEDLGEYINELSKQFPEVSFAKLSRIAVRVAKWKKEHLWKSANGDDLPEIDREVIALLDNGKVVFAHRPYKGKYIGKNLTTGNIETFENETYDKGGWNQPHVLYWLDAKLPYEENKIIK